MVAAARPDGYTLLLGSPSEVGINQLITRQARYDGLKDLTAVGMIGTQPLVLVAGPRTTARDVDTFRTLLAQQPGKLTRVLQPFGIARADCSGRMLGLAPIVAVAVSSILDGPGVRQHQTVATGPCG